MLLQSLVSTALLAVGLFVDNVSAGSKLPLHGRAMQKYTRSSVERRSTPPASDAKSFRFLSQKTTPYRVESLPDVNFDIGEMYSGLIPIDYKNASRALFFVFQPTIGAPVDEITIWLNGGPGCSSLEGFLQENGRFIWQPGTFAPIENPYTWVNLTNMLWVDQPVGTGMSIGTPTATTQEETAQDFIKFFKNFEVLFGIKKFNIYVTGESYAGRYVPYISSAMIDQQDPEYFNLKGALTYDPVIGAFDYVQEQVTMYPMIVENNNLFNLNSTELAAIEKIHTNCGYEDFIQKYLTFPASGVQPPVFWNYSSSSPDAECDAFDTALGFAFNHNPCFNIYEINAVCPIPWDILGFPTELVINTPGSPVYFDRPDVKAALHAPNVTWAECGNINVFVGGGSGPESEGDLSADPIQHVLPKVIEHTNRVLVGNGDYDMIIQTNGTLLSIQNMTWNGKLGFEHQPSTPISISIPDLLYAQQFNENGYNGADGPQGEMGIQHYERGLMWAQTFMSGHMQPEFQPRVSYRHLQWLLGRVDAL